MNHEWNWRGLWLGLPRAEKVYLRPTLLIAGAVLIWGFWGWLHRHDFSDVLIPFTFQEESLEPIQEVEVRYRTYLIEAPVRWAYELRAADILLPRWWSYGVGWVVIVAGWAALLAAVSRAEGFAPYLVYFAWVAWVVLSGAAKLWVDADPFYIVSLGLALVVLLPSYLAKMGIWRLRLGLTALITGGLAALVLGAPAFWRGPVVLYKSLSDPGVISYAVAGMMGMQVPLALFTTLIYPPAVRFRQMRGLWLLIALSGALVGMLIFLPSEAGYTFTVGLGCLGAMAGYVGLQPYYPVFGENLRQPAAFFWGWSGIVLIALGAFGFHAWNHQDLYIYRLAELWRSVLMGGIIGTAIYLIWNFLPLWRAGKMTYWEVSRSVRIPLPAVYFLAIGGFIFSEARNDWPTTRLPARLYAVAQAEAALLLGDWENAESLYREALYLLPYEAKLNYNFARLRARQQDLVQEAVESYERALLSKPMEPAALQGALVWLALGRTVRAIQLLQSYTQRFGGNANIYNQLAYAFYKLGQLDSAAYYWKEAIRQAPGRAEAYAHLAILYLQYDKPEWAATVATSIAQWSDLSPTVRENLSYLRLRGVLKEGSFGGWNAQWLGTAEDTTAVGRFVSALRKKALREAIGYLPYFEKNDPELAPKLARQLGVALLQAGSPRKAAEIFFQARTPVDSLYAGYALAEGECWDSAYALISRLWGSYPEVEAPARREVALLLTAAGRGQEAALIEPSNSWEDMDFLRFGYYAYLRRDIQTLVLVLRPWIDRGVAYDAPYEWAARLFLMQGDTSGAEENIQAGLQRVPTSVRLKLLRAEIALARHNRGLAQSIADSVQALLKDAQDTFFRESFMLRLDSAPSRVQQFLVRFPYYAPAQSLWARSLVVRGYADSAYRFLSDALEVNPYSSELWKAYAQSAERLGMKEEAEFAKTRPEPCTVAP
ncbi:MAG: hypothetical protein NZZ60_07825 [Bacteroidia bacterium]|nr:hypothetical protein [Bacteroidia bacterium]MDW8416167.1 hypothetical protein [Bacteroidia bacterium]